MNPTRQLPSIIKKTIRFVESFQVMDDKDYDELLKSAIILAGHTLYIEGVLKGVMGEVEFIQAEPEATRKKTT